MTDPAKPPDNCGVCAYWRKLREAEGLCCRRAPDAGNQPETAAHWPLTHRSDRCGDGVAGPPFSRGAHCANCRHWMRPEHGLNPVNRGDMPKAWRARAGNCTRHARRPLHDPGPRGFWAATVDVDFCGEGAPLKTEPRA